MENFVKVTKITQIIYIYQDKFRERTIYLYMFRLAYESGVLRMFQLSFG